MIENRVDGLTIDQMAIFVTVVEEGSFSGAARRMNRAQSAITYGVQNLEAQSGTALFDRSSYRPTLTPAGIALLPRARRVLDSLADYRRQAHNLTSGTESRLTFALDTAAPQQLVIDALQALKEMFTMVEVTVISQPMEQTLAALRGGVADLGLIIDTPIPGLTEGLERIPCGTLKFIAVAAPGHPLARLEGPIQEVELREHMQVILSAETEATGTNDFSAHAINRWRVNDLGLRHRMLLNGLGWGGMPNHLVAEDIKAGRLIALPIDRNSSQGWPELVFSVAHLKTHMLGPAGRWLTERMSRRLAD